jgi:hypothetical protein
MRVYSCILLATNPIAICGAGVETAAESDQPHFDINFDIIGADSGEFRIEQPSSMAISDWHVQLRSH